MSLKNTTACLGYQQVGAAGTVAAFPLTIPDPASNEVSPATYVIIQAEAQALRWRDDGVLPTTAVGMTIPAGGELRYDGDLKSIRLINGAAGAIANISYYV
jgi:hypothetical protein